MQVMPGWGTDSPMSESAPSKEYFRRDQARGISPPDLSKEDCTYADHIVRARGRRTKFTSVSTSPESIRDFGDVLYRFKQQEARDDGHVLVEHQVLLDTLQRAVREGDKADRARAIQALRYARMRFEGLVDWRFNITGVDRKDLLEWAARQVRPFFARSE